MDARSEGIREGHHEGDTVRLREDNLVLREIDGETVLLDLNGSAYFSVNRSGTFLLAMLGADHEREELIRALAGEFDIDEAEAARDTDAFLEALRAERLLV